MVDGGRAGFARATPEDVTLTIAVEADGVGGLPPLERGTVTLVRSTGRPNDPPTDAGQPVTAGGSTESSGG